MAVKKSVVLVLVCVVIVAAMLLLYHRGNSARLKPSSVSLKTLSGSFSKHLDEHKHLNVSISKNQSYEFLSVIESNEVAHFLSEMIMQAPHQSSLSVPHSPWSSEFCRMFVGDTFHKSFKVCQVDWWNLKSLQNDSREDRPTHDLIAKTFSALTCYRTSGDAKMTTCAVDGLVLNCRAMSRAMTECKDCNIPQSGAVWLLNHKAIEAEVTCSDDGFKQLESCTEGNDFIRPYVNRLIDSVKHPASTAQECDKFVRGRTHIFMLVDPHNIYFATLAYYDVFKSILDFSGGSLNRINDTVLRVSTSSFGTVDLETERKLFPNFKTLADYSGNVCFQQAVLVPRAYSAVPFRCKTDPSTRGQCQECDGKNMESSFTLFKKQVLKACGLDEERITITDDRKQLVFVSRKPYDRFGGDHHSNFQRVLINSDELIRTLKEKFPNTDINVVHLEEFSFCEQVKLARGADVYMGVHGAGLVHLWWMRNDAVIIEFDPLFMYSNPTFKTLAKLVGQRYDSVSARGTETRVSVNVGDVVSKLKAVSSLT